MRKLAAIGLTVGLVTAFLPDGFAAGAAKAPPAIEGRLCWEAIHRGGGPAEECPFLRARISLRRESATLVLRGRRFRVVVDPIVGRDGRFAGGVHTLLGLEGQAEERIASLAALPGENPNPVLDCRADGAIIYMNPAAERLFPSLREEKLRHPFLAGIGALPAAPARGGPRAVQRVVACGEARYLQTILSRPGEGRFRVYGVDITGHALARENLARLNRTYRVISRINDAIVRSADRRVLFDTACRIMVEEGGFRMAWIGIVDEEARAVRPVSWFGRGAERYLSAVKISYDESPSGSGPAGNTPAAASNSWVSPRRSAWQAVRRRDTWATSPAGGRRSVTTTSRRSRVAALATPAGGARPPSTSARISSRRPATPRSWASGSPPRRSS